MAELSVVGKSILRSDSLAKALGREEFCTDVKLPRMLHMKVLGSPYPHARIVSVDTSEAEKVTGVRCVVTAEDAPKRRYGRALIRDRTVLARGIVRHVGEPVAAVAAETLEAAEEAVAKIKVRYQELPAVFDVEEAASTNPPAIVHPDFPSYTKAPVVVARLDPDRPNVFTHMKIRKGDVQQGFAKADLVLVNRFSTPPIQHCAMEPHAVVIRPEVDGGLTFFTGRQDIWGLKGEASEIFSIPGSKVRVVQQHVGGAFGGKVNLCEVIPALLALKTGRPVKWVYTREEVFINGGQREAMVIYIKDGMKKDGTLVAREIRVFLNAGAYDGFISIVTRNSSFAAVSPYRTPNLKWDSYGTYTNDPPRCAFRGFGITEAVYAIESSMNMMADRLGIDLVEMRRRNLLKEGEPNGNGEITHSIGAKECLDKASDFIRLAERSPVEAPYKRGKGIAIGSKYSIAPTLCQARIKVTEGERIVVYHSADEIGQGVNTVMAQIAAEEFRVPVDDVEVVFSDTAITPYFAAGSTSSRVTYNLGNAVRLACQDAKRILYQRSAEKLGVSPDELETRNKEIYAKANSGKKMRIGLLFMPFRGRPAPAFGGASGGGEIIGTATYYQEFIHEDPETGQIDPELAKQGKRLAAFYTNVAKATEVEVDTETGAVRVIRCCSVTDLGKAINPKLCEQQAEGGVYMGICDAIYEEVLMDTGRVLNPNFTDYKIASSEQMPSIENMKSFFVESAPHKDGPFGAKGIGEAAMIAMQPAIANAVYDAVGVWIRDLPLTPEKVLKALQEKGEEEKAYERLHRREKK